MLFVVCLSLLFNFVCQVSNQSVIVIFKTLKIDGLGNYFFLFLYAFSLPLYTEKSYKRPPYIFPSSSESKIRSITTHGHMNKPMSNSGSVSSCIPICVVLFTQTKHE